MASLPQRPDRRVDLDLRGGWTLARMPAVDRNLLRIGCWEILWSDVPDAVAVSEAVQLATSLSTDDSPAYVNGVLGRLVTVKPRLVLD